MNRIYRGLKSRPYNQRELVVKECVTYTFNGTPVTSTPSGANVQIIQYTAPVDLTDDEFAFSASAAPLAEASGVFESAPTLINTHNLAVTYNSSDENVATIDENGVLTITPHNGMFMDSATITASFAGNDDYNPKTVAYTITVDLPHYSPVIEPEEPTEPENTEEPGE